MKHCIILHCAGASRIVLQVALSVLIVIVTMLPSFAQQAAIDSNDRSEVWPSETNVALMAVSRFIFDALHETPPSNAWMFALSGSTWSSQKTHLIRAQIAVYVWETKEYDYPDRDKFIVESLRSAWASCEGEIVWWATQRGPVQVHPRRMLHVYTCTYGMNDAQFDGWWAQVKAGNIPRALWPKMRVSQILMQPELGMADRHHLARITRNVDALGDAEALSRFRMWWKENKEFDREEWAVGLIDRSLEAVEIPGRAADENVRHWKQLKWLLPDIVAGDPLLLDSTNDVDAIKGWWSANRDEYSVPENSPLF